jgi:hypothetical protein
MRKPDPVEIVATFIPVLAQAVVVVFAIGVACLLIELAAHREPITCKAGSVAALFTDCEVTQ